MQLTAASVHKPIQTTFVACWRWEGSQAGLIHIDTANAKKQTAVIGGYLTFGVSDQHGQSGPRALISQTLECWQPSVYGS